MNRHLARLCQRFLPAIRSQPARAAGLLIAALLLVLATAPALPIVLAIKTGGDWTLNVPPADLPTVPGRDMSVTTYTSPNPQTTLEVNKNPGGWMAGGTGWRVTVHRGAPESWHSNLHLYIQRTSAGNPGGNLIGNLNVYQEVTGTDTLFFSCASQTAVGSIDCQFQITGVSVVVGMTNSTTVIYTVTEY